MNKIQASISEKVLHFRQPAGTSRGVYTTRKVWYVKLTNLTSGKWGIGECAPLPKLSCDDVEDYKEVLDRACRRLEETGVIDRIGLLSYPSILFGLEIAMRQLQAGSFRLWDTSFSRGEEGIPINGLVWMGSFDEMYARLKEKIHDSFHCIKFKIGGIDFDQEIELLRYIRSAFSVADFTVRLDANGAFSPEEALAKLQRLSSYTIHSIEQPIRAGQWQEMARLCEESPIPVALDEEMIGVNELEQKIDLLDTIRPSYIILKPSLHGGFSGCEEWIKLALERGIGYWITSALESNIGLNAIAQWCATLQPLLPQGLGTGQLFEDNEPMPLQIREGKLWYMEK